MRLALSSLILAAGFATATHAQEPATQPAPPPAAPVAAPDAATASPAPAEAAPTPPPPPALPTTGPGAEAISVLEKVCVPVVRGQPLETVAKANGFKLNRREQTWTKPLVGGSDKAHQLIVFPPGSNKGVCITEMRYPMGSDVEVAKALNVWAFVHQPPLDPTANYTQPQDPDGLKRVRRSWEYLTATDSIGLNFSTVRKADDSPLSAKFDTATLQYQERKF